MPDIKIAFLLFPIVFYSCTSSTNQPHNTGVDTTGHNTAPAPAGVVIKDTITKFKDLAENDTVYFKARNGKLYLVTRLEHALDEPDDSMSTPMELTMNSSHKNKPCDGDDFDGKDRKKAKLSFPVASDEEFNTLGELLESLPSDDDMGFTHNPPIATGSTSKRVIEEKRNVHILHTWIYAFARESDEDYHVIVGTTDNKNTAKFFNIEISGLPANSSSSFAKISSSRTSFEDFFQLSGTCHGGYEAQFINQPVEVDVKGALFFDKLHYDGHASIGTGIAKPDTYWEIHPISEISFL